MLIRLFFITCAFITSPALAQIDGTAPDLVARLQRLEAQNRTLTGEVEQLTNLLRRTQDEFTRYREDAEFRFQALEGKSNVKPSSSQPPRRSDSTPPASAPPRAIVSPVVPAEPTAPTALGTPPRTLDQMAAEAAGDTAMDLDVDPNALPLEDGGIAGPPGSSEPSPPRSSLTPPGLPGVAVAVPPTGPGAPPATEQDMAALQPTPEEEYTADYRLIEAKNYETAEIAFRKFVATYPKDKRVASAIHWIGESLFQRQQYRDAAEQFLRVTKDYPKSRRAPSSMLRLGTSLAAIGEKETACATFQEIGRRYPEAGQTVKTGVEKEKKRNGC